MKRVIVTGPRDWTDVIAVHRELDMLLFGVICQKFTAVTGDATGVDAITKAWARLRGLEHEELAADWAKYGNGAGPVRNKAMVARGANLCQAFIAPCLSKKCRLQKPHGTHGTADCIKQAEKAGIPVRRYTA
ncbi:SLOG family protein [Kribbella deserti]|uniref:SLOG family protein n=1 Tax=Kribbella deserti TaxID=1926257 RepID=A0ABV6QNB9_9ACTN